MRPSWLVPLALTSIAAAAPAQTAGRPTVALTILAGAVTGHGLWGIAKQPFTVLNTTNYDTLALSRSIGSSLVLGAAGTYFFSPHVGVHAELSYVGLPFDTSCRLLPPKQPDFDDRNQQLCDNISGQAGSGGAISMFVGVTLRAASQRAVSPYVRGSLGMINLSRSTVEVAGAYVDGTGPHQRQVIADPTPRERSLMVGLAAGFTSPVGPGYQFRLEVRDIVTSLERVAGPANDLAISPTDSRSYHHFALILGFDIVLERTRGRRY